MKNELLHLGPLTLYGYGLMIGIGILAGFGLAAYRARRRSLDPDFLLMASLTAVICGFAGAKLMFWLVSLPELIRYPSFFFESFRDGFVVYGGIIGGIGGCVWYCRKKKRDALALLDLLMPSLALGQGFGRLGCLLAGCCYGKETAHRPWLIFTDSVYAPEGVPLIPVQIYAGLLDFAHAFFLLLAARRFPKSGRIAGLYLVCYSSGRFLIEFLRGDPGRGSIGPLSTSQFVALFTLAAGVYLLLRPSSIREI